MRLTVRPAFTNFIMPLASTTLHDRFVREIETRQAGSGERQLIPMRAGDLISDPHFGEEGFPRWL